jgi:nucleotide-binding universal stress UspA family protein
VKRILIATDGSPASREAVELGIELAKDQRAEVVLVHVVPLLDLVPVNGFGLLAGVAHDATGHDTEVLDEAQALAGREGVGATTALLRGDTVDEIVAHADSLDVDLIVVGSRGHGTAVGSLLGSVSRGVLSESRRPVVVVRGRAASERRRATDSSDCPVRCGDW